jgi:transcription initiation factor TFIIIB Brf1 subunit/transcription initiation factor TFIIB
MKVGLAGLSVVHSLVVHLGERHVLSDETWAYSEILFREAYEKGIDSVDWIDVAAAVIYIAALKNKDRVSPKEIADLAGISEKVLLLCLEALNKKLNLVKR